MDLHATRELGFGFAAITWSELRAWLELNPQEDANAFARLMRTVDTAAVNWYWRRQEAKRGPK